MWKDVPEYEGFYQISNAAVVKSLKRYRCRKDRIIKQRKKEKYLCVNLYKNGIRQDYYIHKLMFEAFIGPCPKGLEICHNDGNPENNLIDNLRCDTHINNLRDEIKHRTINRGSKRWNAKLNDWIVRIINQLLKQGILTQKEIAKIFDIDRSTISKIKRKIKWKHVN